MALQWHYLMVRFRSEKKVAAALWQKGFEVFLPTYRCSREWSDRVKEVELPLYFSTVFCRYQHPEDQLKVVSTPGVLFGTGCDEPPMPVPDDQIGCLRKIVGTGFPMEPCPNPKPGERVRVRMDQSEVEGILVRAGDHCRVVVRIDAIQRAVSIEVPSDLIVRIAPADAHIPK
jgi:hypothetical protein